MALLLFTLSCSSIFTCLSLPVLEFSRKIPRAPQWKTSSQVKPGVINVHIQPHSHNDLGWLKTEDEYLSGLNNSIQQAGVKWIYQSVVQALMRDPNRRFISVEMGFLMRWLELQPPDVVAAVKSLVAEDRLQLCNSGWSMHDEATVVWGDAMDQLSLGARLANATFGPSASARVAWSIDPFGHGATQGILASQMGHSGFFYGRLDYSEQAWQVQNNATEYVWRPSASLGATAQVLAGSNAHGYDPPVLTDSSHPIFEWDVVSDNTIRPALQFGPVQPFPQLDGFNLPQYIEATLAIADRQAAYTLPDEEDNTKHVAFQFGTDFNYMQAEMWFTQIDALISAVNANQSRINLLYSTPRQYMDAKLAQRTSWPLKPPTTPSGLSTDQFPYSSNPHWVWSGYFSSRPALKGYVRAASALFTSARQLQVFSGGAPVDALGPSNPLYALERALATATHHDAVTGTARQHVTYDYARKISAGMEDAQDLVGASLGFLTSWAQGNFTTCDLANATICPSLENPSLAGDSTLLLLYNGASLPRTSAPVRIPVGLPAGVASWSVVDSDGVTPIQAQLVPASTTDTTLRTSYYGAPEQNMAWLVFLAPQVPALGYASFFITPHPTKTSCPWTFSSTLALTLNPSSPHAEGAAAAASVLSNGVVSLEFDSTTGLVSSIEDTGSGLGVLPFQQSFFYYRASPGCPLPPSPCNIANDGTGLSAYGQSATTYIFRPNSSTCYDLGVATVEFYRGPILHEARQVWSGGWASNSLRLWGNSSSVESEWTVGPVPTVSDGWGKEVMLGWTIGGGWGSAQPAPTLFHDSMGRGELQRRVLNSRPFYPSNLSLYEPIAANIYPVTTRAVLIDEGRTGARFTLATDRAQGCASLSPGNLQCLIHRRHLTTTFLGMGEVLDERGLNASGSGLVVRGTHWLRLDGLGSEGGTAAPSLLAAENALQPLTISLAPLNDTTPSLWASSHPTLFTALTRPLPPQLRILTLQSLGGNLLLLRVTHAYAEGEDPTLLSKNASVALGGLFSPFNITGVVETNLGGVVPLEAVKPWTLKVQGEESGVTLPLLPPPPQAPEFLLTLSPMQIRTFLCTTNQ